MIQVRYFVTASSISLRLILVFAGIMILLTVMPHVNPWTMLHVSTEYKGLETLIQIQFQPLNWPVNLNIKILVLSAAICCSIPLLFQSTRHVLICFFHQKLLQ